MPAESSIQTVGLSAAAGVHGRKRGEAQKKETSDGAENRMLRGIGNGDLQKREPKEKGQHKNRKKKKTRPRDRRPKNTTDFMPRFEAPDLRIKICSAWPRLSKKVTVHDVILVPELFCREKDDSVFEVLLEDIERMSHRRDF